MIKGFANKETELLFLTGQGSRFPPDIVSRARRKLLMIDAATRLDDLKTPPSNRLESLKGKQKGQHSIRVNDQWRICFVWNDGSPERVEICDYH